MALPRATTGPGSSWGVTLGFGVVAAVLYAVTWQDALHGLDWRFMVLWYEDGYVHPQHPGYLLAAHVLGWLLVPFGLSTFDLLAALSVLGGATAVAGLHRIASVASADVGIADASETGVAARWLPCWFAGLGMLTPAVWHHSTVVELHAPFLAVVVWAALPLVRWARSPAYGQVVLLGVLTAIAALMHATGQLLVPVALVALVFSRVRGGAAAPSWPRVGGAFCAFLVAHGVTFATLFALVRGLGPLPPAALAVPGAPGLEFADNPAGYLLNALGGSDVFAQFWPTMRREWLEPFAPWSVLVLIALALRATRRAAASFAILLLGYLLVAVVLLRAQVDERGAYLLPLLGPAVWLALRFATTIPLRCALLLFTLLAGVAWRGEPGRLPPDHAFGRAALTLDEVRPTAFFVAGYPEMDGALRADPRLDVDVALRAWGELRALGGDAAFEPNEAQIAAWLQLLATSAGERGRRFLITDRAVEWLGERVPTFASGFEAFVVAADAKRVSAAAGVGGYLIE